ncbi:MULTISPECIES: adenosylcobinamide-GDP ribazoletransferase [Brevundimonas]|uniref:adenosylcobinamide-GDP ribazoletransferase n=1 Tax=Brevundimonas sp. 357 TaxID=2555782 RepID=UPI000F796756|nr:MULTISPECIES: adenosylcobinamide-GDP ribazoletransferase [Brevundimonas]RSB46839.1 adenosylcobinamide-GDP ribazoletransferase [Brevundimonas sp. 357]
MIGREARLFVCALQFLTRLPTPPLRDFQPEWIQQSARWFPLVGQVVGVIAAAILYGAAQVWSPWIAALLAVAAGVALTGGFHEDGLADAADGLGGGQTRARRLEIMKDSRLGSYGALTLGLTLALRVAALAMLVAVSPWMAAAALVASHGLGRAAAVGAMALMSYGGDPGMAKEGKPDRASMTGFTVAVLVALWPLALLPVAAGVVGVAAGLVVGAVPAWQAQRLIGGRTGDVLGAVEQMFEVGFLLAVAGLLAT